MKTNISCSWIWRNFNSIYLFPWFIEASPEKFSVFQTISFLFLICCLFIKLVFELCCQALIWMLANQAPSENNDSFRQDEAMWWIPKRMEGLWEGACFYLRRTLWKGVGSPCMWRRCVRTESRHWNLNILQAGNVQKVLSRVEAGSLFLVVCFVDVHVNLWWGIIGTIRYIHLKCLVGWVLTNACSCYPNQDLEHSHQSRKFSHAPL